MPSLINLNLLRKIVPNASRRIARACALPAVVLLTQVLQTANAGTWVGRPLIDILVELRTNGVPLIYSSQVVTPDLRVSTEPTATQPVARLQEVLDAFELTIKPLDGSNAGFAIVRASRSAETNTTPHSTANTTPLEEVTVFASRYTLARQAPEGAVDMSHAALGKTVGTEQDALRALHSFPGTANNSVSALAYVRGGNEDETLVQFDGVELYNPVHLKDFQGLFGLMDPEFIQSLDFFSGGFPARFGNHTSGVLDIQPRHTNTTSNLLGVSMLYNRAITSGSFDHEHGTWLFGYRRSSLPEELRHLKHKIGDPQLEDFIGRMSYDWQGSKLAVGVLRLNDDLRLFTPARSEQTIARYHDTYVWLRLEHDWSDWLASHLLVSHATLTVDREGNVDHALVGNGTLSRMRNTTIDSLQLAWTATVSTATVFEWGARVDHGRAHSDFSSQASFFDPLAATFARRGGVTQQFSNESQADLYGVYFSAHHSYGPWTSELGLRWDDYGHLDQAKVVSPRLNLRYALTASSSLRLSAGRYVQARSLNNLDITGAARQFRKPESSRQFIVGFDYEFANQLGLRLEAYTKHNEHVRPRSENVLDIVTLAPELKIDRVAVVPQSSSARGIEVSLTSSQQAPLNWWASYTWSQTRDRLNGKEVPRSWDQPHSLTAGLAWSRQRWQHSAVLTWHSGWPLTPLQIEHVSGADDTATLGARNSQRFNDFASLDVRTQYQLPLRHSSLEMFLEIRNVFNRSNDCCRQVFVTETDNGNANIVVRQKSWLGRVPLAGIDWRF